MTIRLANSEDIPEIGRIQREAPEAAQWDPASYLDYPCFVAEENGAVAGFLAIRPLAEGESEILNIAVATDYRRKGIATALLRKALLNKAGETWFLEVRESNIFACNLYQGLGFAVVGRRPGYYERPAEAGIVMRLKS